jgi:hypothetical protein
MHGRSLDRRRRRDSLSLAAALPMRLSPGLWQSKQPIPFACTALCILTIAGFLLWQTWHWNAWAAAGVNVEQAQMNVIKNDSGFIKLSLKGSMAWFRFLKIHNAILHDMKICSLIKIKKG